MLLVLNIRLSLAPNLNAGMKEPANIGAKGPFRFDLLI